VILLGKCCKQRANNRAMTTRLATTIGQLALRKPRDLRPRGTGHDGIRHSRAALHAGAAGVVAKSVNEQQAGGRAQLDRADYAQLDARGERRSRHGVSIFFAARVWPQRDAAELVRRHRADRPARRQPTGASFAASIVLAGAEGAEKAWHAWLVAPGLRVFRTQRRRPPHASEATPGANHAGNRSGQALANWSPPRVADGDPRRCSSGVKLNPACQANLPAPGVGSVPGRRRRSES